MFSSKDYARGSAHLRERSLHLSVLPSSYGAMQSEYVLRPFAHTGSRTVRSGPDVFAARSRRPLTNDHAAGRAANPRTRGLPQAETQAETTTAADSASMTPELEALLGVLQDDAARARLIEALQGAAPDAAAALAATAQRGRRAGSLRAP